MFAIELKQPDGNRVRHRLAQGKHTVGRSEASGVFVSDPHVSRHHADIIVSQTEAYIRSAGGLNGVMLNGHNVQAHGPLTPGETIILGASEILVIGFGENADAAPPTKAFQVPPAQRAPNEMPDIASAMTRTVTGIDGFARASKQAPTAASDSDDMLAFKQEVNAQVLHHLDLFKRGQIQDMSAEELRADAAEAALKIIREAKRKLPPGVTEDLLVEQIVAEAIGLGPIEPLLADDSVTEVMVNHPQQIYVERAGKLELAPVRYTGERALMAAIERIVTPLGRRIDEGSPMVDARLPDGSRVNAIIPPLSLKGPCLTIRKFAKRKLSVDDLIKRGTLNHDMGKFLQICVEYRRNILVSGGTGSGKTTTLNILSNFIPESERIVTVEDAAELQLSKPHVITLEARPANAEGKGLVTIRDLVKNCLRMRPDRIVVGECRGGEALDMLQAMNTGHDGSLTTGHANSPRDFLARLEVMVLMSGIDLPVRAIREQIASAVDIVVQITRFSDGVRRITSIVEVDGMEGDTILMQKVFEFKQKGINSEGRIQGDYLGCGQTPNFYNTLRDNGVVLDTTIFGEAKQNPASAWQ